MRIRCFPLVILWCVSLWSCAGPIEGGNQYIENEWTPSEYWYEPFIVHTRSNPMEYQAYEEEYPSEFCQRIADYLNTQSIESVNQCNIDFGESEYFSPIDWEPVPNYELDFDQLKALMLNKMSELSWNRSENRLKRLIEEQETVLWHASIKSRDAKEPLLVYRLKTFHCEGDSPTYPEEPDLPYRSSQPYIYFSHSHDGSIYELSRPELNIKPLSYDVFWYENEVYGYTWVEKNSEYGTLDHLLKYASVKDPIDEYQDHPSYYDHYAVRPFIAFKKAKLRFTHARYPVCYIKRTSQH